MRNKVAEMKPVKLENAFLMIEKGPVVLISTSYRGKNNIMPLSWITVIDFTPRFALCTGSWNYSYEALVKTKECVIAIPGVDLIDKVIEAGNVSGSDTDKFALYGFETAPLYFGRRLCVGLRAKGKQGFPCRRRRHFYCERQKAKPQKTNA